MTTETLRCPECGAFDVTITEESMFMANTGEHYCHSVKAHDPDAKATCLECGREGIRQQLTKQEASNVIS